ncbi:MAG: trigger factor [Oscillospiraceae bacterium]|nr:trigger factor [Oscillospiraceae bacterium]
MKLNKSEKKENNEVELVVEIEAEELDGAINKAYLKNRNHIAVPGFRKGKAPRKIVERMYGADIFLSDALEGIMPEVLRYAIEETDFEIVGYPKISDVDLKDDNKSAEVIIMAALYPEVKVGEYKGVSAPKPVVEVLDADVDRDIESTRTRNARIEKAERAAQNGDITVIDFEGFVDNVAFEGGKGENYELELGSGQFIPGFEEKVEGMVEGEERDIDLVFPTEYQEDLAGKAVVFKVKLNEVKEKILPELDDEFAKDVSEFDTLDEYKADIKANMLETRQKEVDETFEGVLLDKVVETLEADVPEAMIEERLDAAIQNMSRQMSSYGMQPEQYLQMMGMTPEMYRERMRESSEKQVRLGLALKKIAELEGFEISEEELEDEYKDAAERFSMEVDKIKESAPREDIIEDLKVRKAIKLIVDNAKVEELKEEPTEEKKPTKKATTKKTGTKEEAAEKKPAAKKTTTTKKPAAKKETKSTKSAKDE